MVVSGSAVAALADLGARGTLGVSPSNSILNAKLKASVSFTVTARGDAWLGFATVNLTGVAASHCPSSAEKSWALLTSFSLTRRITSPGRMLARAAGGPAPTPLQQIAA